MAVIKIKDLHKFINTKGKEILKEAKSVKNLAPLGKALEERVRVRTRMGYGVFKNYTDKVKFEPLAKSTQKAKRSKKKRGLLHKQARIKACNLTDSGKMLDNLKNKIKYGVITLFLSGTRNSDIAGHHHAGSSKLPKRPFLYLSNAEMEFLSKEINKIIKKVIKSF